MKKINIDFSNLKKNEQEKPFSKENTPTTKSKIKLPISFNPIVSKGSFHLDNANSVSPFENGTPKTIKTRYLKHRKTEGFKTNQNLGVPNAVINFNNTISGGWNQASKQKTPIINQKFNRNSKVTPVSKIGGNNIGNLQKINLNFCSETNIPIGPIKLFPNFNTNLNNNANSENSHGSQTLSKTSKSILEKNKNANTNQTESTEAMFEADNEMQIINKNSDLKRNKKKNINENNEEIDNYKTEKQLLNNFSKNRTKNKIYEAKKNADFFNDNKIKQYKFEQADEEEDRNFRELCDAFKI